MLKILYLGVIYKVRTLRFRNFRPPLCSCTCTCAFSLHPLPSSTSEQTIFFKEDMTEIYFENYYQSKSHKQLYKINKLLYKTIEK